MRIATALAAALGLSAWAPTFVSAGAWSHTRYELLPPATQSFRVDYRLTVTTPGQAQYFNIIRPGSECSDIEVHDEATGELLEHTVIDGPAAIAAGHAKARAEASYIQIPLPQPVPERGEARLRIGKTYKDAACYFREGERIVFDRPLTVERNTVVLPPHYEVVGCSVPAQIGVDDDGRVSISMINHSPAPLPVRIVGRPLPGSLWKSGAPLESSAGSGPTSSAHDFEPRAQDSRDIVYFPREPGTGVFDLFHDVTVTKAGQGAYLNWVRKGSEVSSPHGWNLNTGAPLRTEIYRGAKEITDAGYGEGREIAEGTELVAFMFDPVPPGGSVRIRAEETYTDPARYRVEGGELVWHRAFGRSRNAVVLPAGWYPVASSMPATVALDEQGRVRLDYMNDRADSLDVYLRARHRDKPEAYRVDGSPVPPLEVYSEKQIEREDNLHKARAAFDAKPDDPAAGISLARHLAWYGRYHDAIAVYTKLIGKDPTNFRAFRHRGHRYLTLRQFEKGVADLAESGRLIEANWATIQNEPTAEGDDTAEQYRWSIWYHLALGQFFARDFAGAEASFRKTLEFSPSPDKSAAASYWLSNTLGRLGRAEEGVALSKPFVPGMDIQSNLSYYELMLYNNGARTLAETLDITNPAAPRFPTLGFGIANRFLFDGKKEEAAELYRRIVSETDWLGFGHIGSEVELHAMGEKLAP